MATRLADGTEYGRLASLIRSWERSLRAADKSPRTLRSYGDSARLLDAFVRGSFGITSVAGITRDHIETFIAATLDRWKPTTAAVRYRSLQQLFKWLAAEGEVPTDPMARMKPPAVPEVPGPVVSDDDLRNLLKTCERPTFEDRRDVALLRTFIESGIAQMLERRCAQAGLAKIHPHQFRRTAAHVWLAAGGSEVSAMRNFGWRSRTMLSLNGASVADERARTKPTG